MNDGNQELDIDNPWTQQLMKFGDWYAILRILFLYLLLPVLIEINPNVQTYTIILV